MGHLQSKVNPLYILIHKGDILLTPKTAHKLIQFKQNSNHGYSAALTLSNDTLWTEDKVNGYYIIGYIINDKLDDLNKKIIPQVRKS